MCKLLIRFCRFSKLTPNYESLLIVVVTFTEFTVLYIKKSKTVPEMTELSTTQSRHVGELWYSFTILDLGTRWKWSVSRPGCFTPP
jgi:hypothetical protein